MQSISFSPPVSIAKSRKLIFCDLLWWQIACNYNRLEGCRYYWIYMGLDLRCLSICRWCSADHNIRHAFYHIHSVTMVFFIYVIWWRHLILETRSRGISLKFECQNHISQNGKGPPWSISYWCLTGYQFRGVELKDSVLLQANEFAAMIQYNLYRQYCQLHIACDRSQGSIVLYLKTYHSMGFWCSISVYNGFLGSSNKIHLIKFNLWITIYGT